MEKRGLAKFLLEGALIVFSVLVALLINQAAERRKVEAARDTALERIALEIRSNAEVLVDWQERHGQIRERLTGLMEDPASPLRERLLAPGFFDLGVLTEEENLIDAVLSSSAWQAAESTGIVSEFDYELVQRLTAAYSLQEILLTRTVGQITGLYFDRETHRADDLDGTLLQFGLLFGELTGQEATLAYLYGEALKALPLPASP